MSNSERIPEIKSQEQIQSEIMKKLDASPQNVAVAASLLGKLPVNPPKPIKPALTVIRKFEVTLYEEDEGPDGNLVLKIVNGGKPEIIEATSLADLAEKLSLYKQCGQTPKIRPIGEPMILNPDGTRSPLSALLPVQPVLPPPQPIEQKVQVQPESVLVERRTLPVRYYKIGGIDVKDDNGKIYQKQWMKLSENESRNIRVVNDKTNAIVNLSGKHIEMMKWILVEDTDDDSLTLEEQVND